MNLAEHQRFLWGLCYRMTGSAAEADDLVQETFARTLERPPKDVSAPLKPWLTKVAVNLARDALRRRRRTAYAGPWLPEPIDTDDDEPVSVEPASTQGRYELLETVSFGFLLALEVLNPKQRAVLLLRDVFDYSVRETAEALDVSQDNVKQLHLRARRAMQAYDVARTVPTKAMQEKNRAALEGLLGAVLEKDVAKVEALLAAGAKNISDGGGQYHAAMNVVAGARKVARFLVGASQKGGAAADFEMRMLNGFPALAARFTPRHPKQAPEVVFRVDIDADGRITAVHQVLASAKLTQLSAVS